MGERIGRLGVVAFKRDERVAETSAELCAWAAARGVELLWHSSTRQGAPKSCRPVADAVLMRRSQAILSIGGDGTLLSAARLVEGRPIPLVGLNFGRLGFLADLSGHDGLEVLSRMVEGRHSIEERTVLEACVHRERKIVHRDRCLNEFFLRGKRELSMIEIEVADSAGTVCDYWADGLLVATPTGSTAYSLALGGPIVEHSVPCVVLTPVAPHSLNVRPLVLSDEGVFVLRPRVLDSALLLSDGRNEFHLHPGDEVKVRKSKHPVLLMRPEGASFSDALRQKLGWSAAPGLPRQGKRPREGGRESSST
jgi:NAD+ kinase